MLRFFAASRLARNPNLNFEIRSNVQLPHKSRQYTQPGAAAERERCTQLEKTMKFEAINFRAKLSKFSDQWKPKIIAQMNDYHFKVVKLKGEFVWHKHDDTDAALSI